MKIISKTDLTTQKEVPTIIRFAIPFILQNIALQMYSMIDGIIASQFLGIEQFAAIGCTGPVIGLSRSLAMGLMTGASILLAKHFGAKDQEKTKESITILYQLAICFYIIITVLGVVGCNLFIDFLGIPAHLCTYAKEYLQILFWGSIFSFLMSAVSSILKSYGDSKTPLYLLLFSQILNLCLDYFFVKYLVIGIKGIALATVLSEAVALFMIMSLIIKKKIFYLFGHVFHLYSIKTYKEYLAYGIPSAIQQSVVQLGFTLNQKFINSFSPTTIIAVTAASKIESFGSLSLTNIGTAMSTYAGQNLGAGKQSRVRSGFLKMRSLIIVFSIITAVIINLLAKPLLSLFVSSAEASYSEIIFQGTAYIRTIGIFLFLFGLISVTNGTLRGTGNVLITAIGAIASLGMRYLSGNLLKMTGFGPASIWMAIPIGWICGLSITSLRIYTLNYIKNTNEIKHTAHHASLE